MKGKDMKENKQKRLVGHKNEQEKKVSMNKSP
jgi:hypothetical protein